MRGWRFASMPLLQLSITILFAFLLHTEIHQETLFQTKIVINEDILNSSNEHYIPTKIAFHSNPFLSSGINPPY